jgi:HEAT repeat protein
MSQSPRLSPEVAGTLSRLARALLVAVRNWTLYPPDHPSAASSLARLAETIDRQILGPAFSIGVAPDTLFVDGIAADPADPGIPEAAALLHERDLIRVSFAGEVPKAALRAFLRLLTMDTTERRQLGGPAGIWSATGHPSMILEQVDYEEVLSREDGGRTEPAERDELWQSIVRSIAGGEKVVFDEQAQARLASIAGNSAEIRELAASLMAFKCAADGSPMIASQAAVVLSAFRTLVNTVTVRCPGRMPDVVSNLAGAVSGLDPHVAVALLGTEEDPRDPGIVPALRDAFDDAKVADLLASNLARDGHASERLAAVFDVIVPDDERKRRALTLARNMLSETDFGHAREFGSFWASAEELLASHDEKPFVSTEYRATLDATEDRAEKMAIADLPPETSEWVDTVRQPNVQALSVVMLIDLLRLEGDAVRTGEIAEDLQALAEDLLMAGAYDDARRVAEALVARAEADEPGREACRAALDRLGESAAMGETGTLLDDLDEPAWALVRAVIAAIGPPAIEALKGAATQETPTLGQERAADAIVGRGVPAVVRLAPLAEDDRWFVQRACARMLGRIGAAEAIPALQSLLRRADPRVVRDAVWALVHIPDPAAARAIHSALRTAVGEARRAMVGALVADRDVRVVPVLSRIIEESRPLGADHEIVLDAVRALGLIGADSAIPILVRAVSHRAWLRRKRLRALKRQGIDALARIGSERAIAAIAEAAQRGDRMLRRIAAPKTQHSAAEMQEIGDLQGQR